MLARYHNVPFRRDESERAAQDSLANRKTSSLELLGNLATAMGFTGTLVSLPEAKLSRAPFPCIAWIEDQPAVIFSITKGVVKAVLPEYGRVQFSLDQWLEDRSGAQLLLLQRGREGLTQLRLRGLCRRSANIDEVWLRFWLLLWCCNFSIWRSH